MTHLVVLGAVPQWVSQWLTTLWILSVGVTLGMALLLVLWGVLAIVSRKAAHAVPGLVREGPLWPLFITAGICVVFAAIGWMAVEEPGAMFRSLTRVGAVGERRWDFEIPAPGAAETASSDPNDVAGIALTDIPLSFHGKEIREMRLESDQHVLVALKPEHKTAEQALFDVSPQQPRDWHKTDEFAVQFPEEPIENLYVRNVGDGEAHLSIITNTEIVYPEMKAIPVAAIAVMAIFLVYFLQIWLLPKASAVGHATFKSEVAQPLFWILMILGITLLAVFVIVPYYTLGEDIKMYKDSGLTLIMVLCIIQAVWAASSSISEELDGRTALTVLSKPLQRRDFIFGKFVGIAWTVGVMFVVFGIWFLIWVAYKPIYDGRETSSDDITWQLCHSEAVYIVPGLVLAFLETMVLTAISVAISTRLPLVANFSITGMIYALGHLTPLIVQSSVGRFPPVRFIGQLIATVFPVLDHLNIQAAISAGKTVPFEYLGWSLLYSLLYGIIAMLVALFLFEERDLA